MSIGKTASVILLKWLLRVSVVAAIAYLAACLYLFFQQTRFIFFPSAVITTTPQLLNLRYQEVWLPVSPTSSKVEYIHGWWIPATQVNAKVLLYLHGNGINIGANAAHAKRFHQMGFSVLLIDYRGYGQSQGSFPSEASVYQDAATAWDYLVNHKQVMPNQIMIYGHSLGGAIAIDLALQHPEAAGLIVESSFTSIREMIAYQGSYWMFPINLLLHQRFDSISKVRSLQLPVLFIHGTGDQVVPTAMSQRLYTAAPEPKQLMLIPKAGHNNVAEVAGSHYFRVVQKFAQQGNPQRLAQR